MRGREDTMELGASAPRWSGMATLAAGLLIALLPLGDVFDLPGDFFFIAILPLLFFFLIGLPGLRASQGGKDGMVGTLGYLVLAISLALMTTLFAIATFVTVVLKEDVDTFLPDWLETLLGIGFFGTVIGTLIFGIGLVIARGLGTIPSLLFLIGLPLGLGIDMATGAFFQENGDTQAYGFYIGVPLFGLSLIWMGIKMLSRGPGDSAPPPMESPAASADA